MRLLSLRQPWATLMAVHAKWIETRSWSTRYRGLVLLHASKTFGRFERVQCIGAPGMIGRDIHRALDAAGVEVPHRISESRYTTGALPLGAVVAIGKLDDVVPMTFDGKEGAARRLQIIGSRLWLSDPEGTREVTDQRPFGDFAPGRFAWLFSDVVALPVPVPATGALGLPAATVETIQAVTEAFGINASICNREAGSAEADKAIAELVLVAGLRLRRDE